MERVFLSLLLSPLLIPALPAFSHDPGPPPCPQDDNTRPRCYITKPGNTSGQSACCSKDKIRDEHTRRLIDDCNCYPDTTNRACTHQLTIKNKTTTNGIAIFRFINGNTIWSESWAFVDGNVSTEDLIIWVCVTNRRATTCVCLQPTESSDCAIFELPRWWLKSHRRRNPGEESEISIEVRRSCHCTEDSKISETVNITLLYNLYTHTTTSTDNQCRYPKLESYGSC